MTQTADYFNRFYHLLLREQLTDPTLHSEWLYFLSMFKQEPLDPNRLELYLGILANEKHKKLQHKPRQPTPSPPQTAKLVQTHHKHKNICEPTPIPNQFKFDKRLSEHVRHPHPSPDFKISTEPLQMRKMASLDDELNRMPRPSLHSDSKSSKGKRDDLPFTAPHSSNLSLYYTNLGLNQIASQIKQDPTHNDTRNRDKHRKLCELSGRLLKIFQNNSRLRA